MVTSTSMPSAGRQAKNSSSRVFTILTVPLTMVASSAAITGSGWSLRAPNAPPMHIARISTSFSGMPVTAEMSSRMWNHTWEAQ